MPIAFLPLALLFSQPPGIHIVHYRNAAGAAEYDWIVPPYHDPSRIIQDYGSRSSCTLDRAGNLYVLRGNTVERHSAPRSYQHTASGGHNPVDSSFTILRATPCQIGYRLGPYNLRAQLIIDPVVDYAVPLAGLLPPGSTIVTSAADHEGNLYLLGDTNASTFPVTPGAIQAEPRGQGDLFLLKLSPSGAIVYATLLGGSGADHALALAVDRAGGVYFAATATAEFFQSSESTGRTVLGKLAPGQRRMDFVYSINLGPGGTLRAIAVDPGESLVFAGEVANTLLPVTAGALQSSPAGLREGFVGKLLPTGAALSFLSYLGGGSEDQVRAIAADGAGNIIVTGFTYSADFPSTPPTSADPMATTPRRWQRMNSRISTSQATLDPPTFPLPPPPGRNSTPPSAPMDSWPGSTPPAEPSPCPPTSARARARPAATMSPPPSPLTHRIACSSPAAHARSTSLNSTPSSQAVQTR